MKLRTPFVRCLTPSALAIVLLLSACDSATTDSYLEGEEFTVTLNNGTKVTGTAVKRMSVGEFGQSTFQRRFTVSLMVTGGSDLRRINLLYTGDGTPAEGTYPIARSQSGDEPIFLASASFDAGEDLHVYPGESGSVTISDVTVETVTGSFSFASKVYEVYPNDPDSPSSGNDEIPLVDDGPPVNLSGSFEAMESGEE